MKKTIPILPIAALFLGLPACLENEEKIEVHPDGSVRVELASKGQVFDLAGGYPIPLDASWRSMSEATEFWLSHIGSSTGSDVRDEVRTQFPVAPGEDQPQSELRVEREFASVEDWPRWFAPESDPYRTAFMERDATLEVKEQARRKVYVFERTYHGVDYARLDIEARIQDELGEDFWKRMKEPDALGAEELVHVRDVLAGIHTDVAELFVRDALLKVYTDGDAALSAGEIRPIVQAVRESVDGLITVSLLRRVNQLVAAEDEENLGQLIEDFETRYRDTMRESLAVALSDARADGPTVNAALYSLEWGFTAFDHYGDLSDEEFTVEVAMPGVLVGGNFHDSDANTAIWKFDGETLQSGDVELRVISVLESGEPARREK